MAKRAVQTNTIIKTINKHLKANRITDATCELCLLVSSMLLDANCYRGFNWFYEDGKVQKMVGSSDIAVIQEKDGYIQFY